MNRLCINKKKKTKKKKKPFTTVIADAQATWAACRAGDDVEIEAHACRGMCWSVRVWLSPSTGGVWVSGLYSTLRASQHDNSEQQGQRFSSRECQKQWR
jgi:hypothetical protein